jgi:DNA-directed RNA polymerase III subunit RPC11
MLLFCPNCGNLLLIEKTPSDFRFFCKTCPYIFIVTEKISMKIPLEKKEVDDILKESWDHLEQARVHCPKCENQKAFFKQFQTRLFYLF